MHGFAASRVPPPCNYVTLHDFGQLCYGAHPWPMSGCRACNRTEVPSSGGFTGRSAMRLSVLLTRVGGNLRRHRPTWWSHYGIENLLTQ
ncbi:hypothetical protein MCAG_03390 [Micromonospora sp. ATCC 39149]|nr:hypothetical protein MCAG_03390 [Micromonospora sp. ATCC 39149]